MKFLGKSVLKSVFILTFILSGSLALAQTHEDQIPVVNGETSVVTKVEIVSADLNGIEKPPYRSTLVATVTYNAICDSPLSFVAIKRSNLDFEIYGTRPQGPPSPIPCQAEYLMTKKIYLAHYLDIHPNATLIKVNGVGVTN